MDLAKKTRNELISLCKERGVKQCNGKRKDELIKILNSNKSIKFIDLFCGLGAFHTAFNTTDSFECVMASDINEDIRKIYKSNYGIEVAGDIRSIDTGSMPDFDILCAGFPCQPFSIAGNKEGFNDQEKGNLFYEILRIIDAKKPPMCILENVKNLYTHDSGNTYKTIEQELTNRSYIVKSKIINAVDFGSPQARQRIFIVATRGSPFDIPNGSGEIRSVSTIIDTLETAGGLDENKYKLVSKGNTTDRMNKPKVLYDVISNETKKGGRQGERVYDINHVGITVCASSGGPGAKTGLYKVGNNIRRLSVKETLGMFGFPSTYNFCGVADENALFYLGNSIVVNVVKAFVPHIEKWFISHHTNSASLPQENL